MILRATADTVEPHTDDAQPVASHEVTSVRLRPTAGPMLCRAVRQVGNGGRGFRAQTKRRDENQTAFARNARLTGRFGRGAADLCVRARSSFEVTA